MAFCGRDCAQSRCYIARSSEPNPNLLRSESAKGLMNGFRKTLYRSVRYNSWVEAIERELRLATSVEFRDIGLSVLVAASDIVIDCGANVGDVTSRCARTGATVYAFEPQPYCYSVLSKRFARLANVRCLQKGVMDKSCFLALHTPQPHDKYDSLDMTVAASFVSPVQDDADSVQVECINLAEFIDELERPVRLLKMDIEGAEVTVLNHLLDTGVINKVGLTVVETHERFSPELAAATEALRERISTARLMDKIRLDWI